MTAFDLVIRGGRVATAADISICDIGIRDGRVTALADRLEGAEVIDATGKVITVSDQIQFYVQQNSVRR